MEPLVVYVEPMDRSQCSVPGAVNDVVCGRTVRFLTQFECLPEERKRVHELAHALAMHLAPCVEGRDLGDSMGVFVRIVIDGVTVTAHVTVRSTATKVAEEVDIMTLSLLLLPKPKKQDLTNARVKFNITIEPTDKRVDGFTGASKDRLIMSHDVSKLIVIERSIRAFGTNNVCLEDALYGTITYFNITTPTEMERIADRLKTFIVDRQPSPLRRDALSAIIDRVERDSASFVGEMNDHWNAFQANAYLQAFEEEKCMKDEFDAIHKSHRHCAEGAGGGAGSGAGGAGAAAGSGADQKRTRMGV